MPFKLFFFPCQPSEPLHSAFYASAGCFCHGLRYYFCSRIFRFVLIPYFFLTKGRKSRIFLVLPPSTTSFRRRAAACLAVHRQVQPYICRYSKLFDIFILDVGGSAANNSSLPVIGPSPCHIIRRGCSRGRTGSGSLCRSRPAGRFRLRPSS